MKAGESSRRWIQFLMPSQRWRTLNFVLLTLIVPGALTACKAQKSSSTVSIDGSSTVYPLSKAIAEAFGKVNPTVQFKIEFSDTGGGFKKFCAGGLQHARVHCRLRPASRPDIESFTRFYLSPESAQYVTKVGYVPLPLPRSLFRPPDSIRRSRARPSVAAAQSSGST